MHGWKHGLDQLSLDSFPNSLPLVLGLRSIGDRFFVA